jgi:hypothetical protein
MFRFPFIETEKWIGMLAFAFRWTLFHSYLKASGIRGEGGGTPTDPAAVSKLQE